jgi:hypothetical protein
MQRIFPIHDNSNEIYEGVYKNINLVWNSHAITISLLVF